MDGRNYKVTTVRFYDNAEAALLASQHEYKEGTNDSNKIEEVFHEGGKTEINVETLSAHKEIERVKKAKA